jgi:hypothetical protein
MLLIVTSIFFTVTWTLDACAVDKSSLCLQERKKEDRREQLEGTHKMKNLITSLPAVLSSYDFWDFYPIFRSFLSLPREILKNFIKLSPNAMFLQR